jgi:hypothetical protein
MYHSLQWCWPGFTGSSPTFLPTDHSKITQPNPLSAATSPRLQLRLCNIHLYIIWSISAVSDAGGSSYPRRQHTTPHQRTGGMAPQNLQPQHPVYGSQKILHTNSNSHLHTNLLPLDLSREDHERDCKTATALPSQHSSDTAPKNFAPNYPMPKQPISLNGTNIKDLAMQTTRCTHKPHPTTSPLKHYTWTSHTTLSFLHLNLTPTTLLSHLLPPWSPLPVTLSTIALLHCARTQENIPPGPLTLANTPASKSPTPTPQKMRSRMFPSHSLRWLQLAPPCTQRPLVFPTLTLSLPLQKQLRRTKQSKRSM